MPRDDVMQRRASGIPLPDLREAQMMVTSLLALRCCFSEETQFILFECLNNTATPITYQLYPTTNAQGISASISTQGDIVPPPVRSFDMFSVRLVFS